MAAASQKKVHPWRLCPAGEHWVRTHALHVSPSRRIPTESVTTRHCHCARNPSGKDKLYPEEIKEIVDKHFSKVKQQPCPIALGFGRAGNRYDEFIAGWTKYWNDIFKPSSPLDPNIVKALIASESSFSPDKVASKRNSNSARGLMQITNSTRKTLADEKGELKEHYLVLSRVELNDPSNNICAGIRWLFQKHRLASGKLGRTATWEEAVAEYKAFTKDLKAGKSRAKTLLNRFETYFEKLNSCKNK